MPQAQIPTWGSFEVWSRTVGGILEYAGVRGFLSDLSDLYDQADAETPEWTAFLIAWREVLGERWLQAGEVARLIRATEGEGAEDQHRRLRDALPAALAEHIDSKAFPTRLGNDLKRRAGTRHGDEQLYPVRRLNSNSKVNQWSVRVGDATGTPNHFDGAGVAGDSGGLGAAVQAIRARAPAHARGSTTPANPRNPRTRRQSRGRRLGDHLMTPAEILAEARAIGVELRVKGIGSPGPGPAHPRAAGGAGLAPERSARASRTEALEASVARSRLPPLHGRGLHVRARWPAQVRGAGGVRTYLPGASRPP